MDENSIFSIAEDLEIGTSTYTGKMTNRRRRFEKIGRLLPLLDLPLEIFYEARVHTEGSMAILYDRAIPDRSQAI